MEKAWIHRIGFCFVVLSITAVASNKIRADDTALQSTVVDVEVQIQGGNVADAKQMAQKLAFEKAVDQFLPSTMDQKLRSEKIKIASSYVKSFRVVDERQEGGVLKSKIRCDLIGLNDSNTAASPQGQSLLRFEITWRTAATQLNSSEFLDFLKANQKLNVDSFKMGRGIFWVSLLTDRAAGDLRTQLSQFLGGLYSVRLIENEPSVQAEPVSPAPAVSDTPPLPSGSTAVPPILGPAPTPLLNPVYPPAPEVPTAPPPTPSTLPAAPEVPKQ